MYRYAPSAVFYGELCYNSGNASKPLVLERVLAEKGEGLWFLNAHGENVSPVTAGSFR